MARPGWLGLHVLEGRGIDAAGIARVPVVDLVAGLVAGDADLFGVDDDDEIAGIDVRRVDGLVLAAQTECHFAGNTSEHLVGGVNHKPLVLHFGRLGAEGLHEGLAGGSAHRQIGWLVHTATAVRKQPPPRRRLFRRPLRLVRSAQGTLQPGRFHPAVNGKAASILGKPLPDFGPSWRRCLGAASEGFVASGYTRHATVAWTARCQAPPSPQARPRGFPPSGSIRVTRQPWRSSMDRHPPDSTPNATEDQRREGERVGLSQPRVSLGSDPLAGGRGTGRASWRTCWRLSEHDRYLRFGYAASDAQIARYVDQLDFDRDEVFGIFNRRLELVAMAHLAYLDASRIAAAGRPNSASRWPRGRAGGATATGCSTMRPCTRATAASTACWCMRSSENTAMLRICRNAGARIERDGPESQAWVKLAAGKPGVACGSTGRGHRGRPGLPAEAARRTASTNCCPADPRTDGRTCNSPVTGFTSPGSGRSPALAGAAQCIPGCSMVSTVIACRPGSGQRCIRTSVHGHAAASSLDHRSGDAGAVRRAAGMVVGCARARRGRRRCPLNGP